jgi:hypothetical protein
MVARLKSYLKTVLVIGITMGPWAYSVGGSNDYALLGFGLLLGVLYAHLTSWGSGAIFGIMSVVFLGIVLSSLAAYVTTTATFMIAAAVSGCFFAALFAIGKALAKPVDPGADIFSGDTQASKLLISVQFVVVPLGALLLMFTSLPEPLQTQGHLYGAGFFFYLVDSVVTRILILLDINLRPAMLFYQEIKPLLRAMWAGLVSFAIGYGFTIILFAGFYMALYRLNPNFFQIPSGVHGHLVWDFIYFSVTTITTIGLSDIKPGSAMFLPQALVSAELIVGIFWVVVYFAVAMTLLQAYAKRILDSNS